MTRRTAMLDHADQQAILLAIHKDLPHLLHIARLFTLAPDRIARAAEKMRIARLACAGKRFFVHERHHQHLVCGIILDHSGYQALAIKIHHGLCPRFSIQSSLVFAVQPDTRKGWGLTPARGAVEPDTRKGCHYISAVDTDARLKLAP